MLDGQLKPSTIKPKPNIAKQQPVLDVWTSLQLDKLMSEAAVK
jgi:hypothetical protein